jgi:hypothetical protein
MKFFLLVAMALLLFLFACRLLFPTPPNEPSPYEKWRSRHLPNYIIDQQRSCFCPHGGEVMRLTVRADTISQVLRISDGAIIDYPYYVTVDSLFGLIKALKDDSLVVRYNKQYGYPEFLDVNPQQHPYDGGFTFITTNLQPL